MADQQGAQTRQSLIEYPCDFPIKVMGARVDGFAQAVIEVVAGEHTLERTLPPLADGVYFLEMATATQRTARQFRLQQA